MSRWETRCKSNAQACEARIDQLVQQSYINEQLLSTVIDGDRNIGEIQELLSIMRIQSWRIPTFLEN